LNWLVYLIPPIAIITGAYILYRAMRAWRQPPPAPGEPVSPGAGPSDPYAARLEEELRQR
jgi:threonine/homoserine/homoserine lactone efflux protein